MAIGKKPLVSYDQSDIAEAEIDFRMENWQDRFEEKPPREHIANEVYQDSDVFQFAWDDVVEYLTELMAKRNKRGYWRADVEGFGWRKQNGYKYFEADKGQEFLQQILPNTDNTFRIYAHGKNGFAIQNFHHDAPTGEWYYVRPATTKEIETQEFSRSR